VAEPNTIRKDRDVNTADIAGLLGRRTRYRGTDIDGPTLAPEGLWVRGRELNTLIGSVPFEAAVWHLWFQRLPTPSEMLAMSVRMQELADCYLLSSRGPDVAAQMGRLGVEMVFATAAGLMCGVESSIERANADGSRPVTADHDFDLLLACLVACPYLMRAALGLAFTNVEPAPSHARRVWSLARSTDNGAGPDRGIVAIDALLTAWHAGFGYITPTVLVPRCAIGTGVTLPQAVAAGLMASGPKHVGAALEAMNWLRGLPDDDAGIEAQVDAQFNSPGRLLFGFGHPLFVSDPRPPHLRTLLGTAGFEGRHLRQFDVVCRRAKSVKGLNPNIDFVTAATLLDAGISDPQWGVGIALCARIVAMAAHAVERRARPAFGVSSAVARRLLAAVPVGWL
jgi:citrate synthase